jgi:tRNA(Arg) A34 adenosine deaminase TadA
MKNEDKEFLSRAISLARENITTGGGPFGALVVKNNRIISSARNKVTLNNDPTAHAEIEAIRSATKKLGTFSLEGCTLYTSCEPCPMCLGAIYWAGIERMVFAADKNDAAKVGFDDSFIHDELSKPYGQRKINARQMLRKEAVDVFKEWDEYPGKKPY